MSALKAWIALRGHAYPLSHNIASLLNFLSELKVPVKPYRHLSQYTPYAVVYRYQATPSDAERIDRAYALSSVQALLDEIRAEIAIRKPK